MLRSWWGSDVEKHSDIMDGPSLYDHIYSYEATIMKHCSDIKLMDWLINIGIGHGT